MPTQAELNKRLAQLFGQSDKVIDRMNGQVEKQLISAYRESLKNVQNEIAALYRKYGKTETIAGKTREVITRADMVKFGRLEKLQESLTSELRGLGVKTKRQVTSGIKNTFTETYYHSGYAVESSTGFKFGFGELNEDVIRANIVNPLDQIKWPERHSTNISMLNKRVKDAINETLIQGYGIAKTSRNLRDKIERSAYETTRILRTETTRARGASRNLAFDKSKQSGEKLGIQVDHVWIATFDQNTRPTHQRLDGQKADEDGYWSIDGLRTQGPGLFGVAAEDINCRCTTITQVDNMEPDVRRDIIDKEDVGYQSYREWAESKGINSKVEIS